MADTTTEAVEAADAPPTAPADGVRLIGPEEERRFRERRSDSWLTAASTLVIGIVIVATSVAFDRLNFDVIVGMITLLVLTIITIPLLQAIARNDDDPDLFRLLVWAFVAKMAFSLIRYFVITVLYGDNADAGVYSVAADQLVRAARAGNFTLHAPALVNRPEESQRIAVVLALFYLITGTSRYAGTFIFSWICFLGQVAMGQAFKRAIPGGYLRRYRVLVLFLPSMLFWPSSIGKEALMIGAVGLVCWGASQILADRTRGSGVLIFLLGVVGLIFIRPHMGLIAIVALGFASSIGTIRSMAERGASRAAGVRLIALIVLIALGAVGTTQLTSFFGSGTDGVGGVLSATAAQTTTGGSEFAPITADNPLKLPGSFVTVLFRPFPWEAGNANGVIASVEGMLLIYLMWRYRESVRSLPRQFLRYPYLTFAATYAFVFTVAFSYVGNFGILARQRTQMYPLFLVALCVPALPPRERRSERRRAAREISIEIEPGQAQAPLSP